MRMKRKKSECMSCEPEEDIFSVIVDRIEGNYAVCEFPNSTMKDVELSTIPFEVNSRDVILVRYKEKGEIEFISVRPKIKENKKISKLSKLIRFN